MKNFGIIFAMLCVMFGSLTTTSEVFASKHIGAFTMSVPVESEISYKKAKGNSQKGLSLGFGIRLFRSDNIKFYYGVTNLEFSLTPKTEDVIQPKRATFFSGNVGAIFYPDSFRGLIVLFAISRGHGHITLVNRSTGVTMDTSYDTYGLKLSLGIEVTDNLTFTMGVQTIGDGGLGFGADGGIRARIYLFGLNITK